MIKKIFLFLLVFGLVSCGYQPIFIKKDNKNFIIEEVRLEGNKKINRQIASSLDINTDYKVKISYILKVSSNEKIETISKDKSGNASIYKSTISVNLAVLDSNDEKKVIKEKRFTKSFSYNTTANKFDLSQYQSDIRSNLANEIIGEIFIFLNQ